MPELDGFELLRRVRTLEGQDARVMPAIAMTSSPRIEDARRALTEGFLLHVKKPLDRATHIGSHEHACRNDAGPDLRQDLSTLT